MGLRVRALLPGAGLAVAIAVVATLLGRLVPVVGAPVLGIVIGAVAGAFLERRPAVPEAVAPGLAFSSRYVLQASIVLLGAGFRLREVVKVGVSSLPVMLVTLAVALAGAALLGRALRVPRGARTLIGVGTGICGASAIAAVSAVAEVSAVEIAYAVGTIFLFNVTAVLLFPLVGHLLGLSQHAFGLWAGTAVNDTSSVVAAGYAYGHAAGDYAVVVKLTRTLMIVPIVAWLGRGRTGERATFGSVLRNVPAFVWLFLLASACSGLVPVAGHHAITVTGVFLITVALAAIGLGTRWSTVRRAGVRPLVLGALLWLLVSVTSLLVQAATGTL